jgi:Glycosyltransferase family 87
LTGLAIALGAWYLSGRTVDFRVYYIGAADFFARRRPLYGALSGIGWPMHYRYPPLFLFLFAPLTLLPLRVSAAVWVVGKALVLIALLRAFRSNMNIGGRAWWVPALIAGSFVLQEFQYGNAQFFTFALVALALLTEETHPLRAAGSLALATSMKVWPLFFFPYLLARGRTRLVAAAALFTVVLTLLPAFYFGPEGMIDALRDWFDQEIITQTGATQVWYPSQSLRGVLLRYLTVIDYDTLPDSEFVRELIAAGASPASDADYRQVHVAAFDPRSVRVLWMVVGAAAYAGLLAVAWASRGRPAQSGDGAAFAALALIQPFTHKTALVFLLWPATLAGVLALRPATPRSVKALVWLSAALVSVQPFFSGSPILRDLQVLGLDFFATCLLAGVMVWSQLRAPVSG